MEETIRESLESMLKQVDDRFEILVVDGGSTDGSTSILAEMSDTYNSLRVIALEQDGSRKLGTDRNISIKEANGNYVLPQLDADDYYHDGILDFVEVYEQLSDRLGFDFYLSGNGINAGPRDLLVELGPYRNIGRGEDKDMWRRLFAMESILWLDHRPFKESLGYDPDLMQSIQNDFDFKLSNFQVGVTLPSCVRWSLTNRPLHKFAYDLAIYPLAYAVAQTKQTYETPPEFRSRGAISKRIEDERRTLSEFESEFDIEIDQTQLGEYGREIFYGEHCE